ncbi:MAG: permease-like cell division protein FtsX [Marinobacter sp.]|nr:permease-like cell division protein FtsX [Marinobacter sp.]
MATDKHQKQESQRGAKQGRSRAVSPVRHYLDYQRRVAKDAARRLWQAPIATSMTWAVMGIALALPVALLLLLGSLQGVSSGWESSARITAYLAMDVPVAQANELAGEVEGDGRVMSVELVERDQALADFRDSSGMKDVLDFLEGNPLPHTLLITPEESARTARGVQSLVTFMEGMDDIERVQVDLGWLQRLNAMTDILTRAAWALAVLLAAAVVLVIGNTVRLAIENRRDEILVAKLVGGTDAFVRRPFLYTGAWFGLGGGVVAWLLIQVSFWWLSGPIERLAGLYNSEFALNGPGLEGALALIVIAVLLGWLGAWVAVKRHMDDIDPGDIAGG